MTDIQLWLIYVKPFNYVQKRAQDRLRMVRGVYDKFPDFFRMGTFIDSTHMKL